MKKILSLVLVLSMVLGSIGFAFAAPADVEGTDYEDAVTRLSALEILAGFPDGTFRPEETVTRAQFAKIMVTALGVGEAAKYAAGQTVFADVAGNHWAAGYINVASDMKIINGYGDGNFGPEDQVTYAQAVTMIVRALGYEPKATAMGGYPGGYLAIAAEKEITEDINVVNTLAAIRGDVAIMVDASLTVPMMVQKTWGQYPEYEEDESKTLMTTKLGVDEITGVVTDIPNTDSSLDADEIKVGTKTYTLKTDVKLDSILGLEVTVWADGSDVFFVDIDTDSDDIKFDTVKTKSTDEDITLYVEDDTFKWAKDAKAFVNFEEVKLDKVPADAYGYAVLNDEEEVTFVNVFDFDEVAVGSVYEIDEDLYKYVDPTDASKEEIELSDYADGVFIYNDKMELVDADSIAVNSAIYAWETSDELYLIVKNEAVQGTLERVKDAEIKVDGTSYDSAYNGAAYSDDKFDSFALYNDVADLDNLGGEAVTVVLDLNGETLFIHGDSETTSSTMYGIVTYTDMGSKAESTVFTKDGEEVNYVFEERNDASSLNGKDYFKTDATGLEFGVMKFKLNADGKIDTDYLNGDGNVTVVDYDALTTKEVFKDADKNYIYVDDNGTLTGGNPDKDAKYYISEDTIFMTVLNSDGELSPAVVDYKDIYESTLTVNDADTKTRAFIYGVDGKDADLVVFLDKTFEGSDDDYFYGVVTDSPWKDGSDYVVTIDVFGEGEKEYTVKTAADFVEGKVVKFHMNSDKEIVKDAYGTLDTDDTFSYDDGYLTATEDGTVKIASNAKVYKLDSAGKIDETVSVSKVDDSKFKTLKYVLDEDGIVVAATVVEKTTTETPEDQEGEITIVNSTVKDGDDVVKVALDASNTNVYKVNAIKADGTATTIQSFFSTKTFTTADLGINGLDETVLVRLYDADDKVLDAELITVDNTAPTFTASITGTNEVTVVFNEKVDKTDAETKTNYVYKADGTNAEAVLSATLQADGKTVVITTTTAPTTTTSTIDATVEDTAGNTSASSAKTL